MSHPDPHHDDENERSDDDLLRMEEDERRREDEAAALAESLKAAAYADYYIRRDKDRLHYGYGTAGDTAPDGRPLMIGTQAYETWVKDDKRSDKGN